MAPDHPGAGIPHDIFDLYLYIRSVTMYLAVGASCFVYMKGASVETTVCIVQQTPALGT